MRVTATTELSRMGLYLLLILNEVNPLEIYPLTLNYMIQETKDVQGATLRKHIENKLPAVLPSA